MKANGTSASDKYFYITLALAISVLGFRIIAANYGSQTKPQKLLSEEGELISFDTVAFTDLVINSFPRVRETPIHLVVFMNPETDCPVCLYEMNEWVAPLTKATTYGLTFFIPENISKEMIQGIKNEHVLTDKNFIEFREASDLSNFHELGVFKVLLSQERGIVWYQKGSRNQSEYDAFSEKLAAEIRKYEINY